MLPRRLTTRYKRQQRKPPTKYLTKATILKIKEHERNEFAVSHLLSDEYLATLDPDAKLPISLVAVQKQTTVPFASIMRFQVDIPKDDKSGETEKATIDMSVDEYKALPEME